MQNHNFSVLLFTYFVFWLISRSSNTLPVHGFSTMCDIRKAYVYKDSITTIEHTDTLKEVLVVADRIRRPWYLISACIRSKQVDNGVVSFYGDAKVTYAYREKKGNFRNTYLKLSESRFYANQELLNSRIQYKRNLVFKTVGVPELPFEFLPQRIFDKCDFKIEGQNHSKPSHFLREGRTELTIREVDNGLQYELRDLKDQGIRKGYDTEVNLLSKLLTMNFSNDATQPVSQIDSFEGLTHFKMEKKYRLKHEKETDFLNVIVVDEVFIEDVVRVAEIDKDEFQGRINVMPKGLNHVTEFWKTCDCDYYEPPDFMFN